MQNIYLIGFMGAGKSHIGQKLAQALSPYQFIDLDNYILQKSGEDSISSIFKTKGEAYFRLLEKAALEDSLAFRPAIIATGGGTPCFGDHMDWMNQNGLSIFLNPQLETLYQRLLKGRKKRPLIAALDDETLLSFIKNLLEERLIYYNQAQVIIKLDKEKAILKALLTRLDPKNEINS